MVDWEQLGGAGGRTTGSQQWSRETMVGPEEGLHARPAARIVKTAKGYSSRITVTRGGREANAKSPLSMMSLGAQKGEKVVIRAEGDEAERAVDAVLAMISANEH